MLFVHLFAIVYCWCHVINCQYASELFNLKHKLARSQYVLKDPVVTWRSRQHLAERNFASLRFNYSLTVKMESFIESGKALGLEGDALKKFVEKNEAERIEREGKKEAERIAREERKEAERLKREAKKEAERLAREEKKESDRLAREERAKQREENMAELQMLEKDKVREYELAKYERELEVKLLEKQIKLERVQKMSSLDSSSQKDSIKHQDVRAKIPKLPPFNEKSDNMDAYLKRFERFAEMLGGIKKTGQLI